MESLLVHGWLQNKAGSRKAHSTTIKKHVNRSRSANESRGLIAPPSIRARSHTTPTGKPYRIHHGRVGTDNFSRHSEAGHNDPITDILFPMRRMHIGQKSIYFNHFSNSETWDKSKYVKSVQESRGEILITLFYSPERQHLGVTISRAKNLIRCNETSLINSFVTVWMVRNGELIDKRTGAMKRQTTDPIFNDAFAFFVPQGKLDETQIIVAVSDVCSLKVMDEIGHVLLSIGSTASSQQHWRELLCNPGKKITRWHTLTLKCIIISDIILYIIFNFTFLLQGRIRENDVIFNSSGINESSTPARRTLPPPESLGSIFTSMMLHLFRNYMLFPAEKRAIIYVVFVMLASIIADLRPLSRWHYFVRKDNVFNLYFVKWGWAWVFTFLGTFIVLTSYVYTIGNLRHVLTHFFRMIISTFIWWFCVTIFVHVEKRTGFCTKKSYAEKQLCIMNGGRWLSFDVSGHCFLLIYCCLLMAEELRVFKYWDHIKYALDSNNRDSVELAHLNDAEVEFCKIEYGRCTSWIRLFFVCTTMLNFLWEVMLIVTVLYFHSLAQKFAGTVIAVCCWYFTYRVWYRSEGSPGLPGVGKLRYQTTL